MNDPRARRRAVVVAGHRGAVDVVRAHADDPDAEVRVASLGALARLGELTDERLAAAAADADPRVRRRAAELAGGRPFPLRSLLDDPDPSVVEVAAWACGEQADVDRGDERDHARGDDEHNGRVDDDVLDRLVELTTGADEPLVREAAAAALGAIGDPRGLPAILAACRDKPHVRRRAVLALAPFEGDEVDAAIERALADRDWQVRQAAEDLRRATGEIEVP